MSLSADEAEDFGGTSAQHRRNGSGEEKKKKKKEKEKKKEKKKAEKPKEDVAAASASGGDDDGSERPRHRTRMRMPTAADATEAASLARQQHGSHRHRSRDHSASKPQQQQQKHATKAPRALSVALAASTGGSDSSEGQRTSARPLRSYAADLAKEAARLKAEAAAALHTPRSDSLRGGDADADDAQQQQLRRQSLDDGGVVVLQHVFRREDGGATRRAQCDVCGDALAAAAPVLRCVACGFVCHTECQYDPKAGVCMPPVAAPMLARRIGQAQIRGPGGAPVAVAVAAASAKPPRKSLVDLQRDLQAFQEQLARDTPRVVACQAFVRGMLVRRLAAGAKRRKHIVEELLTTERNYVSQLRILVSRFKTPLIERAATASCIVPAPVAESIFGSVGAILAGAERVLVIFEEAYRVSPDWVRGPAVGKALIDAIASLVPHIDYAAEFSDQLDVYAQCLRIPAFAAWEKATVAASPELNGLDMQDLLILPVQRVMRYIMLAEDLLSKTDSTLHPDRKALLVAVRSLKRLAQFMNERRRRRETMALVRKELLGIDELVGDAWRCLVRKGPLMWGDNKKHRHDEHAFLFNDVLVLAQVAARPQQQQQPSGTAATPPIVYQAMAKVRLCDTTMLELKKESRGLAGFVLSGCLPETAEPRRFATIGAEERDAWASSVQNVLQMHAWRPEVRQQSFITTLLRDVPDYALFVANV